MYDKIHLDKSKALMQEKSDEKCIIRKRVTSKYAIMNITKSPKTTDSYHYFNVKIKSPSMLG